MTIISPGSGNTLALTLNGATSVGGTLTKPATVPSAIYQILNSDPGICFIRFGSTAPTATANDLPIPSNVPTYVEAGSGNGFVAVVAPGAATGVVRITPVYAQSGL